MEDDPYLVEDLFGLMTRYIRHTPELYLSDFNSIYISLNLSINAIGISNIEASKSVYNYLENVFLLANLNYINEN